MKWWTKWTNTLSTNEQREKRGKKKVTFTFLLSPGNGKCYLFVSCNFSHILAVSSLLSLFLCATSFSVFYFPLLRSTLSYLKSKTCKLCIYILMAVIFLLTKVTFAARYNFLPGSNEFLFLSSFVVMLLVTIEMKLTVKKDTKRYIWMNKINFLL